MTDDDMRAQLEEGAGLRLKLTPCEGSKPEHFGFYAERVHGGFVTVMEIIGMSDVQFRAAATMFALYYERFANDNKDTRFINRVCADVMAKGADRPTAWEVALQYHGHMTSKFGPDFDLDNYQVVVMTEAEATPEVVHAFMAKSGQTLQ